MTDSPPPAWTDDLFRFATPSAFAALVEIAWQANTQDEYYDTCMMQTHYDFMFDLWAIPRPPQGWEDQEGSEFVDVPPEPPFFATPEFVPFGSLGDGTCIGWAVPAPELGGADHPVVLVGPDEPGAVVVGQDTRAGLEFMLSRTLRRWRERPPSRDDRELLDRLVAEVGLRPDPDRELATDAPIPFEVPAGWRHESSADGIGVLAPDDAFTDEGAVVADVPWGKPWALEPVLDDASQLLDAGYPATALLGLRDTFHTSYPYFSELRPLWARAYRDLGRPQLAEDLDLMTPVYERVR
ncbi:hypothetical protein ACFQYP_01755 [Nonomuraea antimicrobica]